MKDPKILPFGSWFRVYEQADINKSSSIPADTIITVDNSMLLVKANAGKIKNNYQVKHKDIGTMDAISAKYSNDTNYLELTLNIPYGKGVFVKPKIEDPKNKEQMSKGGIYANYIKGSSLTSNDKLYLKVNLVKNKKAIEAVESATNSKQTIDLGNGFNLIKV